MIDVLVILVVIGVLLYILELLPIDATIKKIIWVVAILIAALYALQALGIWSGPILRR